MARTRPYGNEHSGDAGLLVGMMVILPSPIKSCAPCSLDLRVPTRALVSNTRIGSAMEGRAARRSTGADGSTGGGDDAGGSTGGALGSTGGGAGVVTAGGRLATRRGATGGAAAIAGGAADAGG